MRFSASGGWNQRFSPLRVLLPVDTSYVWTLQRSARHLQPWLRPVSTRRFQTLPVRKLPQLPLLSVANDYMLRLKVITSYLDSFGPSLHPHYRDFLATTASADFSQTLIREISPGKVLKLSARAAKLYLMRLSVTVGFRVP